MPPATKDMTVTKPRERVFSVGFNSGIGFKNSKLARHQDRNLIATLLHSSGYYAG
jgi:hypothetical protein